MRIYGQADFPDDERSVFRQVPNSNRNANLFAFNESREQNVCSRRSSLVCRSFFHCCPCVLASIAASRSRGQQLPEHPT